MDLMKDSQDPGTLPMFDDMPNDPVDDLFPTVYAPQIPHRLKAGKLVPAFNLAPAEKFGPVKPILAPSTTPFALNDDSASMLFAIHKKLKGFDPARDFFLCIGNPILMSLCFTAAWNIGNWEPITLLQWSNGDYKKVTVTN
jgi:hypothetical protein